MVDNEEACARLEVTADWVLARSGIRTRRFAGADETLVAMAVAAGRGALDAAGLDASELGLVLVATMSAEGSTPQVSTRVAHELGAVQRQLPLSKIAGEVLRACNTRSEEKV